MRCSGSVSFAIGFSPRTLVVNISKCLKFFNFIDDACTAEIIDPRLGVTTHKMGLHGDDDVFPLTRPVFKTIEATHRKFYKTSVSAESRIEYKLCDNLPDHDKYDSVMVMSRSFIDKNTVLHEVSGHHFQLDQDLIVPGTLHCPIHSSY